MAFDTYSYSDAPETLKDLKRATHPDFFETVEALGMDYGWDDAIIHHSHPETDEEMERLLQFLEVTDYERVN